MKFLQYMKKEIFSIDGFCEEVKQCLVNRQYERFESIVRDNLSTVNNYEFIQRILSCPSRTLLQGIEILLNCGVDTSNFNIQYFIEANNAVFGYGTGEGNLANSFNYSLTLSIIRIILQNPGKQEKYGNSCAKNENPLHSIMHSIFANLNSVNGDFRWDDARMERENAKRSYLLLFALVVLTDPSLLGKKNYDPIIRTKSNLTPLELLALYKTIYRVNHPYLQELYDNFQEIIELTQSDKHSLSSTMKRLISHINCTQDRKRKLLDYSELEEIVDKIKQEVKSQGNTLAEKCAVDLSNLIIDNLPTILLDTYRSTYYRDLLKRKVLERFYEVNIGNVNTTFGANFYVFQEIIGKFDIKTLDNFMKAILSDICIEKLNLNDNNTFSLQSYIVERINGNSVIENSESIALDFLAFKEFLESNIAPHETKYEEKRKNKKLSEEALNDIRYLYEEAEKGYKDSGTQLILEEVSLVASKDSKLLSNAQVNGEQSSYPGKNNPAPQNAKSKLPVIAASMLAITGVATGIAVAVYLEMLAVGIAVGACCLVAAAIVYCYSRPSSSLENSNVQEKIARDVT